MDYGMIRLGLVLVLGWLAGCGRPEPPSVLLVTLDTTRWDCLGAYGDPAARTPAFDALARRGTLFRHAFVDAPTTLPSHATLLTGAHSLRHGVRLNGKFQLPEEARTVTESFRDAGYETCAVLSSAAVAARYGLDQGFEVYADSLPDRYGAYDPKWRIRARRVAGNQRRAGDTVLEARRVFAERAGRVFAWVHFVDPHQPADPPFPWGRVPGLSAYAGDVAYMDRWFGVLCREFEASFGAPVIAVLSDHGESLGEHRDEGHALSLYDSVIRVPFALVTPATEPRIDQRTVTNADLAPTLLTAAGLPSEPFPDGRDLLAGPVGAREFVIGETLAPTQHPGGAWAKFVRTSEHKYILAPTPEVYRIDRDPEETDNVWALERDVAAALHAALAARLDDYAASDFPRAGESSLDAAQQEALAALGYVVSPDPVAERDELVPEGIDPKDLADMVWAKDAVDDGRMDDARARVARFWSEHPAPRDETWNGVHARMHFCQAALDFVDGRPRESTAHLRRSIELDPEFADPRVMLARLEEMGR